MDVTKMPADVKPILPCFSVPNCALNSEFNYTGGVVGPYELHHNKLNLHVKVTFGDKTTMIQPGNGAGMVMENAASWGVSLKYKDGNTEKVQYLYYKTSLWNEVFKNFGKIPNIQ